jgi:hypothetical protein
MHNTQALTRYHKDTREKTPLSLDRIAGIKAVSLMHYAQYSAIVRQTQATARQYQNAFLLLNILTSVALAQYVLRDGEARFAGFRLSSARQIGQGKNRG